MDTSTSGTEIRREWDKLRRLSKRDPRVVYLGYRTGQMALHLDSSESDVHSVFLTALSAPGLGDSPMVFYHAVIHRRIDDGRRVQRREQFRHPFPALDWIHETVPDFDLLETVCVNLPDEDATGDPTSSASEQ